MAKHKDKTFISAQNLNMLTSKMDVPDIAKRLGVSVSTIYTYRKEERAPIAVELACKLILNEIMGNNNPSSKELVIFRANKEDVALVCRMLAGLSIKYSRFTD